VADGNFKLEHIIPKCPEKDVWLSDGTQFMTSEPAYQSHLATAVEETQVCHVHLTFVWGLSLNYLRNTNVKITEQSVKQMYIARTIYVLLELVLVLVAVMDASIPTVLLISRREKGAFLCFLPY
jgi:hypothetical protein